MLKQLTDSFYWLSTEAEELLQQGILQLREECALSEEDINKISAALVGVKDAYCQVREYTSSEVGTEDMPGENVPISVYVAIINNKKMVTEGILKEFLQVHSTNAYFELALCTAQEKAKQLLQAFQEDMSSEPDVAPYRAFVDGIKMGDGLASDEGDALLDVVETIDKKLARGLLGGYYVLQDNSVDEEEKHDEAHVIHLNNDGEQLHKNPDDEPLIADYVPAEDGTTPVEETSATIQDEGLTAIDEAEEVFFARNYKAKNALPSTQKMKKAFCSITGLAVINSIGIFHLFTKELFKYYPSNQPSDYDHSVGLNALEDKGYLVAYEVSGEVFYCPSQMLADCIDSPDRSRVLMHIRHTTLTRNLTHGQKKIKTLALIGTQKIKKDILLEYIAWLKTSMLFYKIGKGMPIYWDWDRTAQVYRVSGCDEAEGTIFTNAAFVRPDMYQTWIMKEENVVCSHGDDLPSAEFMKDAVAKECFFFTDKLYHWVSSSWVVFNWRNSFTEGTGYDDSEQRETDTVDAVPSEEKHEQSIEDHNEKATADDIASHEEIASKAECTESKEGSVYSFHESSVGLDHDTSAEDDPQTFQEPSDIGVDQTDNGDEEVIHDDLLSEVPARDVAVKTGYRDAFASAIRNAGSIEQRDHYLKLAYEAYATGRQGIGSTLMRALMQMHPEVSYEWRKWACATDDTAYSDGRNATKLQEVYADADPSNIADSALTVSAYIRMYFSNDAANEYWVRSADAISSTKVLKELNSLRGLIQRLQKYVNENHCGINEATLVSMRNEFGVADQFVELRTKANDLINARWTETGIPNSFMKNILELMFGYNSIMMSTLRSICEDRRGDARQIRDQLFNIDPGLLKNSQRAIENWMDKMWYSPNRLGKVPGEPIIGHGRSIVISRTKNALSLINQWIELCIHNTDISEQTIIAAAAEVDHLTQIIPMAVKEVEAYKATVTNDVAGFGALVILEGTLRYFDGLINGENAIDESLLCNVEIAACDSMAVDEDGDVYIIPAEDMVVPYEQCMIIESILWENLSSAEDAALRFVENSMTNDDPYGGNFGNGKYLLNCVAKMYQPSLFADYSDGDFVNKVKYASLIFATEEKKFHAHMEMAQGYGWFTSFDEQDRIERAVAAQCEMYRLLSNFSACVDCMKRTFNWCRQTARSINHDRLMEDLHSIVMAYDVDENNATIVRVRKLIEQDCYSAATAEIRKIHNDGRIEDRSTAVNESEYDFFIQNFQSYYSAVSSVNTKLDEIYDTRNRYNHRGYVSSGREMLRSWPQSPEGLTAYNVRRILERLDLKIANTVRVGAGTNVHVEVEFPSEKPKEFVHPIADFGTDMFEGGLDAFYLGGNKTAEQYFDMIRSQIGRGSGHAAIFFANSAMSLSVRRQLTSKIWHELRSARPFVILDRVLALYVAENERIDRWNVLLRCALPFTMVKPYTEKSNAQQPPEMFVGRVRELQNLMEFGSGGANLLYGGRQLGKSAILYRIEQEMHNEAASTYVIYCSIKDKDADSAVPFILLAMITKGVPGARDISLDVSWDRMCLKITEIMATNKKVKLMLLLDEADIFLGKDKESKYASMTEIKRIQDTFGDRFKFVFAGLHNVMRLHHNEALDNNSDMPKLGHINIRPLDYADAETLLKKPLSYLGFMFNDSEAQQALISMILSTTNYYPGLIHYYCASLLNTFGDGHTEPAPNKPPYEFDNKLILNLLQKKEFMEQTKQKFMMTLGIDKEEHQYYSILAYLMAYCYDENESQVNGVSVNEICEAAEMNDISVVSKLEASQVETLLDELCELNILYCAHGSLPKRYVFSRPSFKDMLGTQDDVMEALLSYIDVEEVSQ